LSQYRLQQKLERQSELGKLEEQKVAPNLKFPSDNEKEKLRLHNFRIHELKTTKLPEYEAATVQAKQALIQCLRNLDFKDTLENAECTRIFLGTELRKVAVMEEIHRILTESASSVPSKNFVVGAATLTRIIIVAFAVV